MKKVPKPLPLWKQPFFIYTMLHLPIVLVIGAVAWFAWTSGIIPK